MLRNIVSAMLCIVCSAALSIAADDNLQPSPRTPNPASQERIKAAELNKAAVAYIEVRKIHEQFQDAVQETKMQDERRELQEAANAKLVKAIENAGISLERYNFIMGKVRTSELLSEKFIWHLNRIQEK